MCAGDPTMLVKVAMISRFSLDGGVRSVSDWRIPKSAICQ